ncbi:MAG TPA: DedA family protein [Kofleriaceae bacterium]|jgi:membrane protein DedA with SNARE-associated domain|nr:DedA family protein [Kofleriaceae bacterium]
MSIAEQLTMVVGREDSLAGWAALAGAATIEYVFPPFPGDVITILGAVLVTAAAWSWLGVLSAVMVGSLAGAALVFELGRSWGERRRARGGSHAALLDRLVERFRRHGAAYLVVNRFVPGVRSLFFVAAGLAGMRRGPVYAYAMLSALLYNLALFALGAALGANLDRLERLVMTYTVAFFVIAGVAVAGVVGWKLWQRRRHRSG